MTYIPETLRRLVAQRTGGRCEYCRLHEDDAFFTHEVDLLGFSGVTRELLHAGELSFLVSQTAAGGTGRTRLRPGVRQARYARSRRTRAFARWLSPASLVVSRASAR